MNHGTIRQGQGQRETERHGDRGREEGERNTQRETLRQIYRYTDRRRESGGKGRKKQRHEDRDSHSRVSPPSMLPTTRHQKRQGKKSLYSPKEGPGTVREYSLFLRSKKQKTKPTTTKPRHVCRYLTFMLLVSISPSITPSYNLPCFIWAALNYIAMFS